MRTYSVQSRLDSRNLDFLKDIAQRKGVSISLLVRIALLQFVERETTASTNNYHNDNEGRRNTNV